MVIYLLVLYTTSKIVSYTKSNQEIWNCQRVPMGPEAPLLLSNEICQAFCRSFLSQRAAMSGANQTLSEQF